MEVLAQRFGDEVPEQPLLPETLQPNATPQLLRHARVEIHERLGTLTRSCMCMRWHLRLSSMRLERRLAGLACWRVLYEAATLTADAEVAELADAEDSKSSARKGVGVRLPSSAVVVQR